MELLTIGAFARASRLSAKALRLYGELGLLPPVQVDPVTGYRFYHPSQLERARLVAWLRRLEMPLSRIRQVCELPPAEAAREVASFWAETEAEIAVRRDLAAFLTEHLGDGAGVAATPALAIRYAVRSDAGLVRAANQDAAYADSQLLAVADGFGTRGAPASHAVIAVLRSLTTGDAIPVGEVLSSLHDAVGLANRAIGELIEADPLAGEEEGGADHAAGHAADHAGGSTLTAMLWTGSQLALVHIGDSRAYLLREGELFQISHDHTVIQSMVDAGFLDPAEAASHPQRALLLRALDGREAPMPDLHLHDALAGDRYLLYSDGLSTVVPSADLHRVLAGAESPQRAVDELVELVQLAGAPDNVSCVVAHVLTAEG